MLVSRPLGVRQGSLEPYHLVHFAGHLDISRYPEFRSAFEAVPQGLPVLIDLTEVEGADSTFLSELVMLERRHDGALVTLIPADSALARLFAITNLGERLHICSNLAAARDALKAHRPPKAVAVVNEADTESPN